MLSPAVPFDVLDGDAQEVRAVLQLTDAGVTGLAEEATDLPCLVTVIDRECAALLLGFPADVAAEVPLLKHLLVLVEGQAVEFLEVVLA
jgi:hypothetical protein